MVDFSFEVGEPPDTVYTRGIVMNDSRYSAPAFYVDTIPVHGNAILSPMDGYSDWPFRSLCRGFGSAMSYTE
jgi:hypothetical protein